MAAVEVKGFLFDLDGTLVDTHEAVMRVTKKWCALHEIEFSPVSEYCHTIATVDTVRRAAPHLDAEKEAERIETMEAIHENGLPTIAGAHWMLEQIAPADWAIVTSSSERTTRPKLTAGKLPIPEVVITSDSVEQRKPHPEPYLLGAEKLGLRPENCLAFEDSISGGTSALDAGCFVIFIGEICPLQHPNIIGTISSYEDLKVKKVSRDSYLISA